MWLSRCQKVSLFLKNQVDLFKVSIKQRWLCWTDVASVSHNTINNNGWQAHYLCLSAPSVVWQTRRKLNSTNCPSVVLKYARKQPRPCSNFFDNEVKLSLALLCRRGCSRTPNLLFFFSERMVRTRSSSPESIFFHLCSILSQICVVAVVKRTDPSILHRDIFLCVCVFFKRLVKKGLKRENQA